MNQAKAAPARKSSPPPASLKKRLTHTFYLVQPVIQFFALVAMIGILSRCSPLSPSTDKSIGLKNKTGLISQPENSENAEAQAREQLISENMIEISQSSLELTSDAVFEKNTKESVARAGEALEAGILKSRLKNRFGTSHRGEPRKIKKLLSLRLNPDQQAQLIDDGMIRIDLSQSFISSEEGKKILFDAMQESLHAQDVKKLDAYSYLIFANETMRDAHSEVNHSMHLKILISIPAPTQAFLEIRVEGASSEARVDAIAALDEALQDSGKLAIVLE